MNNFQRIAAVSNSHVGRDFESAAQAYFLREEGLTLDKGFPVDIGAGAVKKSHRFDLGSEEPPVQSRASHIVGGRPETCPVRK